MSDLSQPAILALSVSALCALAATARAADSDGPEGELYGGLIARTLAVGDRSDSRISYYIPQIIERHLAPASIEAEQYFTPWTFYSRGPLAGLAATPVLFATGGIPAAIIYSPAEATAFYPWRRFDPTGFAAYRIVLMVLASMTIFALFAVLAPLIGESWALIGGGLLALSPFGMHEIMFTWPKLEATAWVLASFLLAHQRAPFLAGISLAVGFLFHPLAALWTPWLALWSAGRGWPDKRSSVVAALRFALGLLILVLPWMALGRIPAHLKESVHAGQGGFVDYFLMADNGPATWTTWWRTRWQNFANTFLPFWLHLFNEDNPVIGSPFAPSGRIVKFAFSWWNTLPLGMGLALWVGSAWAIMRSSRQFCDAVVVLILAPALLLTAYWGASPTGLMRECGHPLLAAIIGIGCFSAARLGGKFAALVAHPLTPWLLLPETLLMIWLTTYFNPHQPSVAGRELNSVFVAVNLLALGTAAWVLSRARKARPVALT